MASFPFPFEDRIDRVASHEHTFVVIERIGAITRRKFSIRFQGD